MHPDRALFRAYPRLAVLPFAPLADLPTPVTEVPALAAEIGAGALYVKRDDLTAEVYGGNKVRKLEFLLGEAKARGAKEVITFGYAGSNHCTATAIHARAHGLRSISMLVPQPTTEYLRRNLLASAAQGALLKHYRDSNQLKFWLGPTLLQRTVLSGARPYIIPPGGSSPLGTVGFVNAALELADQIAEGAMPKPDVLYLPFSSMGSVAGLGIGLQAAGLTTRIEAIQVVAEGDASHAAAAKLAKRTVGVLREEEPDFPAVETSLPNVTVRTEFFGEKYGVFTDEGTEALGTFRRELALDPELALDGTYSGKALAGLFSDAADGALAGKNVLFWNTFNAQPFWRTMNLPSPSDLPARLRGYFEGDLQALDEATRSRV